MRIWSLWRLLLPMRGDQGRDVRPVGEPNFRRPRQGDQGPQPPDILQDFMPAASATIIDLAARRRLSSGR